MATLAQIAAKAEVSLATASRALNTSSGRKVRPDLAERVLAAAKELGYPTHKITSRSTQTNNCIAVLVNNIADPYFAQIVAGVESIAERDDCLVTIISTGPRAHAKAEAVKLLADQQLRAIIIAGGLLYPDAAIADLAHQLSLVSSRGIPVASIGTDFSHIHSVKVANHEGAVALAQSMIERGYRDVILLAGPGDHKGALIRSDAIADTITTLGGRIHLRLNTPFGRQAAYDVVGGILTSQHPQLLMCVSDGLALGAMSRLHDAGISIPDQIAISGFSDIPILPYLSPRLTSVDLNAYGSGQAAARIVMDPPQQIVSHHMDYHVHLRESTPYLKPSIVC